MRKAASVPCALVSALAIPTQKRGATGPEGQHPALTRFAVPCTACALPASPSPSSLQQPSKGQPSNTLVHAPLAAAPSRRAGAAAGPEAALPAGPKDVVGRHAVHGADGSVDTVVKRRAPAWGGVGGGARRGAQCGAAGERPGAGGGCSGGGTLASCSAAAGPASSACAHAGRCRCAPLGRGATRAAVAAVKASAPAGLAVEHGGARALERLLAVDLLNRLWALRLRGVVCCCVWGAGAQGRGEWETKRGAVAGQHARSARRLSGPEARPAGRAPRAAPPCAGATGCGAAQ